MPAYLSRKPGTGVFSYLFISATRFEIIALLSEKDHQCYIVELVPVDILAKPRASGHRTTNMGHAQGLRVLSMTGLTCSRVQLSTIAGGHLSLIP